MAPAASGLSIAATIPILPEIPTKDPVYFGPKSAWFTPNPPEHMPEQTLIRHKSMIAIKRESSEEI